MIQAFKNIWNIPDLRRRVMFTFAMLGVYRIGGHIPTPGIDSQALLRLFEQQAGSILGFVDLFSGGNFSRLTIFALLTGMTGASGLTCSSSAAVRTTACTTLFFDGTSRGTIRALTNSFSSSCLRSERTAVTVVPPSTRYALQSAIISSL